jgi:TolB protein
MRRWLPILALLALAATAHAQTREVRIDIAGGGRRLQVHCEALAAGRLPAGAPAAHAADEVLAADLEQSGVFLVSRAWAGQTPFDVQAVVGGKWKVDGGTVTLEGEVRDVPARRPILVRTYRGPPADWRSLVHRFADDVVLQFTGEPGVSGTRIAFAVREGRNKELWVMDLDGAGAHPLTHDGSLALSPSWSPDGALLAFCSYRDGGSPHLFVVPAAGGRIFRVSGRPGLNTGPAYSPDGREIACSLSKDGNAEIYVLDAQGGSPRRLTDHRAIDTSPTWSPTGREIAFTSDRSGSPQVYVMDRDGGNVRRLTYEINYTDSPAWSPRGDLIAMVSRTGSGFDLYVCGADGSNPRLVVSGSSNENPHWSPDGRHLVFASDRGGRYALYVSDLDGRPPRMLDTGGRVASSPAWSPFRDAPTATAPAGTPHTNTGGTP